MPHIEEGELHALLDGAYASDSREADRLRAHLQDCADCRALLEAERALRGRANELLEYASPRDTRVPPFEVVQSRAHVRTRRWGPRELSWAASIMLALGLGWFGRDLTARKAAQDAAFESSAPVTQSAQTEAATPAPPPPQPEAPAPEERDQAARGPRRSAADVSQESAAALTELAAPPPAAANLQKQESQRAEIGRATGAAAPAPAPPAAPLRMTTEPWVQTSLEAAERTLGRRVLLVPGFELVGLEIASGGSEAVRAFQRVPGDGVLEIVQEPVRAEGAAAARERRAEVAADAAAPVSVVIGNLRVTARAPLSADSLRVLLGRLR